LGLFDSSTAKTNVTARSVIDEMDQRPKNNSSKKFMRDEANLRATFAVIVANLKSLPLYPAY